MNVDALTKFLTIRHLRIICALSELGLVARVAESLNVTQPAVSKQISELERLIDTPIVTRERNRLSLTPVGRRLAEHARQMLDQLDRAAFDLSAMASGVSGSVAVGVVGSIAPLLLPATIAQLKRSAPAAGMSVTEGHFVALFPQLEGGVLDLLIARAWQPQNLSGFEQCVLFQETLVVVAGRDHPLAARSEVDWAEAIDWPWMLPQEGSIARRAVEALFTEFGLTSPVNVVSTTSLLLGLGLMREIPLLGFYPLSLARAYAVRGELIILPLDTRNFLSEARCYWRKGQLETNPTLDLFMTCLKQAAASV
jgi:DNA-binding transcriptional LysR family regulator